MSTSGEQCTQQHKAAIKPKKDATHRAQLLQRRNSRKQNMECETNKLSAARQHRRQTHA